MKQKYRMMKKTEKIIRSYMAEKILSKEYLLKYFVFIYFLIFITALVSGSIIFYLSEKSVKNEIHKRNQLLLNNMITDADNKYMAIISEAMYFEKLETTNRLIVDMNHSSKFHYSPSRSVITSIVNIKEKIVGIEDVILFFRGNDYIFSTDGLASFNSYFAKEFDIDDRQLQKVKLSLTSLENINIVSAKKLLGKNVHTNGDNKNLDYIIMSIPLTGYNNFGVTISFIINSNFFNMFNNYYNDIEGNLIVIDSEGKELISVGRNDFNLSDSKLDIYAIKNDSDPIKMKASENTVSITAEVSTLNKWTYMMVVPYSYIQSQTNDIKNTMIYTMLLFMGFGAIAAYKLGQWQYKPIKMIMDYMKHIIHNQQISSTYPAPINGYDSNNPNMGCRNKKEKRTDEFAYIKQGIGYLQSMNINMKQFIDDSMPAIKQNIIYKLLLGLYGKNERPEDDYEKYNIDFKKPYHLILVLNYIKNKSIHIAISEYLDIRNSVINMVLNFLSPKFQGYSAEIDLENSAIVIGFDHHNEITKLNSICNAIVEFFNSQIKIMRLTIFVSEPTDDIRNLSKIYKDTFNIVNFRSISGHSEVVLSGACLTEKASFSVKEFKTYEIINSIVEGKHDEALLGILDSMKSFFDKESPYTYNDLINALTGIHKEIDSFLSTKDASIEAVMQLEIMLLSEVNSICSMEELTKRIKTYFNLIRDILDDGIKTESNSIIEEVKAYVKVNYNDQELYLGKVALDMNVTANYISHIFKSNTGMSFPEYLTTIRIQAAEELLTTTREKIKDISTKCGYTNVSTLIRSFKSVYGISPGKYRDMHRK